MLGLLTGSLATVTMQGDALLATMHVAHLSGGTLAVPPGLTSAVIEIGCSDRDTMDDEELDTHFPNSFLLSFEPLVDKYALLLAKGTKRFVGSKKDIAVPLGRHHKRGVVLPFAISPVGGDINFTVSAVSGCSSMAQIHPQSRYKNILRTWGLKCDEAFEKRIVPSITLEQALRLTGELPVLRLKIDAQGVDLQLVRSVPPAYFSSRVETVELEFAGDNCKDNPLYVGQASESEVVGYMASLGYTKGDTSSTSGGCEGGAVFHNRRRYIAAEEVQPVARRAARQWRDAAGHGTCGATATGILGDCGSGNSGSFMLAPPPKGASFGRAWKPKDNDAAQERSLVAHCLALCAGCERCRFVSLSAQWNDCSWYHKCPLNRLDTKTAGFFSGAALSNTSRGLAHSRPS